MYSSTTPQQETYNSEYGTLPEPENVEKIGYTFGGWNNEPDRVPANDLVVTAQWVAIEKSSLSENPEKPSNH